VDDYQFENLIKAVESCFKQNYCALYFEDLVRKFGPEINGKEIEAALEVMHDRGQVTTDCSLLRLIVQ